MWLQPGQLIVMRGETQQYWQHRLNRSTKILQPRINLTFVSSNFHKFSKIGQEKAHDGNMSLFL